MNPAGPWTRRERDVSPVCPPPLAHQGQPLARHGWRYNSGAPVTQPTIVSTQLLFLFCQSSLGFVFAPQCSGSSTWPLTGGYFVSY